MLAELRKAIADDLTAAGVRAVEYTDQALTPPVAAVIPAQPYLTWGNEDQTFANDMRVRIDVLCISHQTGSGKADADLVDQLLEKALGALDKYGPRRATRPGVITVSGSRYMGAVITIESDHATPTTPEE